MEAKLRQMEARLSRGDGEAAEASAGEDSDGGGVVIASSAPAKRLAGRRNASNGTGLH
jgi:hypothetical protein